MTAPKPEVASSEVALGSVALAAYRNSPDDALDDGSDREPKVAFVKNVVLMLRVTSSRRASSRDCPRIGVIPAILGEGP